jgi:mono/diheme cytochrome c family protein
MENTTMPNTSTLKCGLFAIFALLICSVGARGQSGAATFKANCTPCHGDDGSADTPTGKALKAADLRAPEIQKKADGDLATVIANGKGNMPSFKATLSDDQIKGVIVYIRTLKKK